MRIRLDGKADGGKWRGEEVDRDNGKVRRTKAAYDTIIAMMKDVRARPVTAWGSWVDIPRGTI